MSKPPRTSHVDFFCGNLLSSVVCKLNSRLDSVEVRDLGRGGEDIFVSIFPKGYSISVPGTVVIALYIHYFIFHSYLRMDIISIFQIKIILKNKTRTDPIAALLSYKIEYSLTCRGIRHLVMILIFFILTIKLAESEIFISLLAIWDSCMN